MKPIYRILPAAALMTLTACTQQEVTPQQSLAAMAGDMRAAELYTSKMGNADITVEDLQLMSATSLAFTYYRMCLIGNTTTDYIALVAKAYKNKGAPQQKIDLLKKFAQTPSMEGKRVGKDNPLCNGSSLETLVSFSRKAQSDLIKNGDLRPSFILGSMLERALQRAKSRS